jgi:hypothetical protein
VASRLPPWIFLPAATACAALAGLEEPSADPPAPPAAEAGAPEAAAADTGIACAPGATFNDGHGLTHAERALPVPTIDGDGADWRCAERFLVPPSDRARLGIPAASRMEVALQWDDEHLYFWARAETTEGSNAAVAEIYRNDSVHLYVARPMTNAIYAATDRHFVFDVRRQVAEFGDIGETRGNGDAIVGLRAKVGESVASGGRTFFEVEAAIDAVSIGRPRLSRGDRVRVNFQLNDATPGDPTPGYRVWFIDAGACGVNASSCDHDLLGTSEPYCDPRCTGEVELR